MKNRIFTKLIALLFGMYITSISAEGVAANDSLLSIWTKISFPSEKHVAEGFLPYAGESRGQAENFFGVSPANPNFMIQAGNMRGQTLVAQDGTNFFASGNISGKSGTAFAFSPHDGSLAFGLYNWGLFRTSDMGSSWQELFRKSEGSLFESIGSEMHGKRILMVDPSAGRQNHLYYASPTKGLLRSDAAGDEGSWSVIAFEDRFVKTLTAGITAEGTTRIYAVVGPDNVSSYRTGQVYRIDVLADNSVAEPVLVMNSYNNIIDVEVNSSGEFGCIIRNEDRAMQRFKDNGNYVFADNLLPSLKDDNISLGSVYANPYNDAHWVVSRGYSSFSLGGTNYSFVWSNDSAQTWNDEVRAVVNNTVPSLQLGNPEQHHTAPYGWGADVFNHLGSEGVPTVGFLNDSTVAWKSTIKDRPIFKSTDYGKTGKHFTSGSETKWVGQINSGYDGNVLGVALGEYGVALSIDGGISWKGYTSLNTPAMVKAQSLAKVVGETKGGQRKRGVALVFKNNEEGAYQAFAGHSSAGFMLDVKQLGSGNDWNITLMDEENGGIFPTPLTGWSGGFKGGGVAEAYLVSDHFYMGNLHSEDQGATFQRKFNDNNEPMIVLGVSSRNGNIAVATPNREKVSSNKWALYVTINGGETWSKLPGPPKENVPSADGVSRKYYPVSIEVFNDTRHALAIDPREINDPEANPDGRLRILLAGRRGIYEFNASNQSGSEGEWTVRGIEAGFYPSIHFNLVEEVPWLGGVQLDPRENGVVYAFKSTDNKTLSDWRYADENANLDYNNGGTFKPVYQSMDWGETWHNIDTEDLPDWLTVATIHVTEQGVLYVGSVNSGIYRYTDQNDTHISSNNISNEGFRVYPNPAQQTLNIELEKSANSESVIIYNMMGHEIKHCILKESKININVSDWPAGMYFVKVEGAYATEKVILK